MLAVVIIAAILAFIPRVVWRTIGLVILAMFIVAWIAEPPTKAEQWGHVALRRVAASEILSSTSIDTNGNHSVTITNNSGLLVQNILMTCKSGEEEYDIRLNAKVYPHTTETASAYDFRGGYGTSCSVSDWDNYKPN